MTYVEMHFETYFFLRILKTRLHFALQTARVVLLYLMLALQTPNTYDELDTVTKPTKAYKSIRITYVLLYTQHASCMFRPLLWPSSRRCVTKDILQQFLVIKQVGKFSLFLWATNALRVSRGIALLFLGPRHTRWGGGSAPRPGRLYPRGKTRYPLYRRLGRPQVWSGRTENVVPTGIRSRSVQPIVSRYTD